MHMSLKGRCLCDAIQYELSADLRRFYHCHCGRCRKATGTGHSTNLMVETDRVTWLQGESKLKRFNVPEAERYYTLFCSDCGSPMPRAIPQLGVVAVPAGSVDHDLPIEPQARIFWASRATWSCDDGLNTYDEYASE